MCFLKTSKIEFFFIKNNLIRQIEHKSLWYWLWNDCKTNIKNSNEPQRLCHPILTKRIHFTSACTYKWLKKLNTTIMNTLVMKKHKNADTSGIAESIYYLCSRFTSLRRVLIAFNEYKTRHIIPPPPTTKSQVKINHSRKKASKQCGLSWYAREIEKSPYNIKRMKYIKQTCIC